MLITNMDKLLRRLLGEDVELVRRWTELGHVKADPGQIEQVIMNLAVNARDAMPGAEATDRDVEHRIGESYSRDHVMVKPGNTRCSR